MSIELIMRLIFRKFSLLFAATITSCFTSSFTVSSSLYHRPTKHSSPMKMERERSRKGDTGNIGSSRYRRKCPKPSGTWLIEYLFLFINLLRLPSYLYFTKSKTLGSHLGTRYFFPIGKIPVSFPMEKFQKL